MTCKLVNYNNAFYRDKLPNLTCPQANFDQLFFFFAKQCKKQLALSEVFQTWEYNYSKPKQSQTQPQGPDL